MGKYVRDQEGGETKARNGWDMGKRRIFERHHHRLPFQGFRFYWSMCHLADLATIALNTSQSFQPDVFDVFVTPCSVFVFQHRRTKMSFATKTKLYGTEEHRGADGKLNEFLVPFQSQLSEMCSFTPRAFISLQSVSLLYSWHLSTPYLH